MYCSALVMISDDSDVDFLEELFDTYRQMMFKSAMNILKNKTDAEDAVQNSFLHMIDNVEKIKQIPHNEMTFYVTSVEQHAAIDIYRKKNRHSFEDIDTYSDIESDDSVEERALSNVTVENIKSALEELPDRDYDLLYRFLIKEMDYSEIGRETGISPHTVRVYIQRARKRFIKILKERGIVDDI